MRRDDLQRVLHDRVDARERLVNRALEVATTTAKAELARAIDVAEGQGTAGLDTFRRAMELVAAAVADRLDQLTTEAVVEGARYGKLLGGGS